MDSTSLPALSSLTRKPLDIRYATTPLLQYVESHNDDITELRYHPTQSTILLSGSTDGLINIYDTTITDEDEALRQITNHGSSIHHASFLDETTFFGLSHDEVFSIYPIGSLAEEEAAGPSERESIVFGDLRPKLDCGYVVDVYPYRNETVLAAGLHSKQCLDLVPLDPTLSWSPMTGEALRLSGAHGGEIVRSLCFKDQTIFTAGEDGMIRAWGVPDAAATAHDEEILGASPKMKNMEKHKRPREKDARDKGRFKPY
ncbi:MAG: hypothetical protein Q9217_004597 [Psora testacea]